MSTHYQPSFQNLNLHTLAYLTAVSHGFVDEATSIQELVGPENLSGITPDPNAVIIEPSYPITVSESNWPLLTVSKVRKI